MGNFHILNTSHASRACRLTWNPVPSGNERTWKFVSELVGSALEIWWSDISRIINEIFSSLVSFMLATRDMQRLSDVSVDQTYKCIRTTSRQWEN